MAEITIVPATPDRFADAQHALTGGGDGASCQCMWWMLPNTEFQATDRDERERMLHAEVDAGPPPALIAYVDGEAAGWVRVGPRTSHARLARTRAIAGNSPEPWDDPDVWTVSCFAIRREHRGLGLTARLLDAAIALARAGGARTIEAYPIDTAIGKTKPNDLYHGSLSTFERAGFAEVGRAKPTMAIVSLAL